MSDSRSPSSPVVRAHEFFRRGPANEEGWSMLIGRNRRWESSYRDRWRHDKIVRSTHGVNCTGSCSWNVYVKDGLITWETQAVDYPRTDPSRPDHEPRGCPRGASFSWYTYSPVRLKHPLVRGSLLERWRAARDAGTDPVDAWAQIAADGAHKAERGRGGFVRATWDEVTELIAAATVHTIDAHGPDRVAGFTPIPAMSPVSFAAGTRFLGLIGAASLSFYDWYADLPPASPQVFGDQTDVPESADWWDASYLVIWGTNIPITRTPDAHFMTEARYRGQKVVVVSPDHSDHVKFADDWLPAQPGTDGALAMAMGHVILQEFWAQRQVPRFVDYARRYSDFPLLVTLREREDALVPDRFLTAEDLGEGGENAAFKTCVLDDATGRPAVPNGSAGFRWGEEGKGRWNLVLGDLDPVLSLHGRADAEAVAVDLPRFDVGDTEGGGAMRRGVPAIRVGGQLVTTVLDLMLATYGVARDGLPGDWPTGYDDAERPYTPAWQQAITGVDARLAAKVAREFARNAEVSGGRSMICMGAGTNHWFHSDEIYRSFIALLVMCGCVGVNGGGFAHYVGQEKIRTFAGWQALAGGLDWRRPPRHAPGTAWYYTHTEQWRYDRLRPESFTSPLGRGLFERETAIDAHAKAVRLGWMPSHPTFDRNPLTLAAEADDAGRDPVEHVVEELRAGRLGFAVDAPSDPRNWPRVFFVWRSNLLGSSGKGQEYFLRHLLGSASDAVLAEEAEAQDHGEHAQRPEAPRGKLDLLVNLDFRMTTTGIYSDVVLPAATWYEKYDLSMTDMHPFVHSFNQAVPPPWECRTDWEAFKAIARRFSELGGERLGTRRDVVATAIAHDSPGEVAQPHGRVRDWRAGECEPIPGQTMPALTVVERDYGAVHEQFTSLGPLMETLGSTVKSASWKPVEEVEWLGRRNGLAPNGRPSLARAEHAAEAMLALSGVTNGRVALAGFKSLQERCGVPLTDLAERSEEVRITFQDTQVQPRRVLTSPEWSGIDEEGRAYAAFTINVERDKPWHTLSGRMHMYLDHEWMLEYGEALPAYRPPLGFQRVLEGERPAAVTRDGVPEIQLRYLTPHSKWSIHSEYQDNLHMLTLFRGGSGVWMNPDDAASIDVRDNDWIEAYNRNGVLATRAVVSHRVPRGVCLLYHSKDRHINTPRAEITGTRGGTENSLTAITMKPTHMIGAYGQLSWGHNYYGPTGSNRDSVAIIRKRRTEVTF